MSTCARELRQLCKPAPRTCERCGLGPCRPEASPTRFTDAVDLTLQIAETVFPHNLDAARRAELALLLRAFAAYIKRSAIEL